jgi:hypothetical protein
MLIADETTRNANRFKPYSSGWFVLLRRSRIIEA